MSPLLKLWKLACVDHADLEASGVRLLRRKLCAETSAPSICLSLVWMTTVGFTIGPIEAANQASQRPLASPEPTMAVVHPR